MYMMVGLDAAHFGELADDMRFTQQLIAEQSVFCLPGKCFKAPGFFRIVFTAPRDKLETAYARMAEFCSKHSQHS